MKAMLSLLCFLAVSPAMGTWRAEVTPVQKVIQLMNGMLEKGKKEKHEEQVQFASYKQFCEDTTGEKAKSIEDATSLIEVLAADIQKYKVDAATLGKEITQHDADIAVWQGDQKAATKVRQIEKADYDTIHKDQSESIDALGRAVTVLKEQSHDRKQAGAALVQVSKAKLVPDEAKQTLMAFLAEDDEDAMRAPEANAYEFQSSGVVEMLEKLEDKFVSERTDLEKEEKNSKHAYDMLMQDLAAQIDQGSQDVSDKTATKAAKLQSKASATADKTDTTAARAEDKKYLSDLSAECEQKTSDFAARQQLRAEEIEAIEKAIEIISGGAVSGSADKHLPALMQFSSLAQLRTDAQSNAQARMAAFLQSKARQLNSRLLSALAVRASDDPFVKVKKMIKDLVIKLMEEANEEAEHKGWCDTELGSNKQTRKEKTEAVELLHAEIDEFEASIAKLSEQITTLSAEVAESDAAVAKATKLRQAEKEANTATITDAQEAQTAVAQALQVLKDFYAKAGDATAFLQQKPEIFDSPYKGMQSENGGVVGMIEVIASDFARLEAETRSAEELAQKEYDRFMSDSAVLKSSKTTEIEHKTTKKGHHETSLQEKRSDLEGTQKELDAALAYFDKLKPSCVDAGVSYEDRVARRKEEIESLQEALKILNGEDIS